MTAPVNVYDSEYQSAPCNYDWYQNFIEGFSNGNQEAIFEICKTEVNSQNKTVLLPKYYMTNLFCKSQTQETNLDATAYTAHVYKLISASPVDEIDPTMTTQKIPSIEFEFKVDDITKETSVQDINIIINSFIGQVGRYYRGFYTIPSGLSLRDENGLANLDYHDYIHDNVCLGVYKIKTVDYNYDTNILTCDGEQLGFTQLKDITFKANDQWNQRYPYAFNYTEYNETQPNGTLIPCRTSSNQLLGYPADKVLSGDIFLDQLSYNTLGVFGSNEYTYGLSTSNLRSLLAITDSNGASVDVPLRWAFHSIQYETEVRPGTYTRTLQDAWDSTSLCNTWKNETFFDALNSFCIMNYLRFVPSTDGNWNLISGLTPTENPFEDTASTSYLTTNGKLFESISGERYFVTPRMLKSKTIKKENLSLSALDTVKSYAIGPYTTSTTFNSDEYSVPTQTITTDSTDFVASSSTTYVQTPSNINTGFPEKYRQPLKTDRWYLSAFDDPTLTLYDGPTNYFPNIIQDYNRANNKNCGIGYANQGDDLVAFQYWFNSHLSAHKVGGAVGDVVEAALYQPYTIALRYVEPSITTKNSSDALVVSSDKSVDSVHFLTGYVGLPQRILNTANGTYLNPLYKLTWDMIDDPSLRVGTVCYVPLNNQYIKCYITKQSRAFTGGSTLTCEAWALEETNISVYDYSISDAIGHVRAESPNWDVICFDGSWTESPLLHRHIGLNVEYRIYRHPQGGDYELIETVRDDTFTGCIPIENPSETDQFTIEFYLGGVWKQTLAFTVDYMQQQEASYRKSATFKCGETRYFGV